MLVLACAGRGSGRDPANPAPEVKVYIVAVARTGGH